jgi:hypothetical protein
MFFGGAKPLAARPVSNFGMLRDQSRESEIKTRQDEERHDEDRAARKFVRDDDQ